MPKVPESSSWWQTLPGVLTAIAALITAVAGLVAVLVQTGVIDASRRTTRPDPADSALMVAVTGGASSSAPKAWADAEAVITDVSNTATVVRAETLSNCISVNHVITLNGNQDIPFERMRSFEIVRVDPAGAPQAKATVRIKVLDGRTIEGRMDAGCDMFGYNDLGRFAIVLQTLKRVEFRR